MRGPRAYPSQDILLPANAHKGLLLALFVTRHFRQVIQCQEMVSAMKYSLALQLDQHEAEHTDANRTDLVWQKNSANSVCLISNYILMMGMSLLQTSIHPRHDFYTN